VLFRSTLWAPQLREVRDAHAALARYNLPAQRTALTTLVRELEHTADAESRLGAVVSVAD